MNIVAKKDGIKELIADWLYVDIDNVDSYIELIFSRLGFRNEDIIEIYDVNEKMDRFFIKVNDNDYYRIKMENNSDSVYPMMYVRGNKENNYEDGYQCIFRRNKNKLDLELNLFMNTEVKLGRYFTWEVNEDYVEYRLVTNDYELEFRLDKPKYLRNNNGIYSGYNIFNHLWMKNYFYDLDLNESILDIYKKLCDECLGNNVSRYGDIDLRIMQWINGQCQEVTQLIQVQDGELVSLLTNRDGKVISYSLSGSWLCDTDKLQVMFDVSESRGMVSFNSRVNFKEEICKYDEEVAYDEMETARCEVGKVRKLVREMFPRKNNSK